MAHGFSAAFRKTVRIQMVNSIDGSQTLFQGNIRQVKFWYIIRRSTSKIPKALIHLPIGKPFQILTGRSKGPAKQLDNFIR